jgi:hypothetical protein
VADYSKNNRSQPTCPLVEQKQLEETFEHFLSNPRPELVGYLFTYESLVPPGLKEQILTEVLSHFDSLPTPIGGALFCYLRLYATHNLPAEARERLHTNLIRVIGSSVEISPEKWASYCIKPLWAISSPDSPFARVISEVLEQHHDYEIERQCENGSWTPHWTWCGVYPEDWKIAEREWRGIITRKILRALRNFGRFQ